MRRDATPYAERKVRPVAVHGAVDVTTPQAGWYRFRLRSGGIRGAVRIWHGPPHDPVTGEELDRSWRWQAEYLGEPIDFDRCWPTCASEPITEIDYNRLCLRADWARNHAPDSAYADPSRKHDALSAQSPLPF
jgi:hypothetical protein